MHFSAIGVIFNAGADCVAKLCAGSTRSLVNREFSHVNGPHAKSNLHVERSLDNALVFFQGDEPLGRYSEDALDLAENVERLRARQHTPGWSDRALATARRLMSWRRTPRVAP